MEWLSYLQFANIPGLLLTLVAPLLIFAYLKKNTLKRNVVSSLIVLSKLPRRKAFKRRIHLPLRFFLELAALLLLALAAASPFLRAHGEHIALVIDNTLSMRARSGGTTRFDEAIKKADKWIFSRNSADRFSLYVSSPRLSRVSEENDEARVIQPLLKDLNASFTTDTLQGSLNELAGTGAFDRIVVVTDREADYTADQSAMLSSTRETKFEVLTVGEPSGNFYIASLRTEESALKEENTSLIAAIGMSGPSAADVKIRIEEIPLNVESGARLISSTIVRTQPDHLVEVTFSLPRSGQRVFHLELDPPSKDALSEDNEGWILPSGRSGRNVLVINGRPDQQGTLGLEAIRSLSVEAMRPEVFAALEERELQRFSLVIYYDTAPTRPLRISSLLVLPPAQNTLFPIKGEVKDPVVSSWRDEHPIAAYLKVPLLKFPAAQLLDVPPWASCIIRVEQGCLIAAGESQGIRFAASGAQLFPFEGAKTPAPSVLVLNLLSWLAGTTELSDLSITGSSLRLEPGKNWNIEDPRHEVTKIDNAGSEPSFYAFNLPGVYNIWANGAGKEQSDTHRTFVVNAFHSEESATFGTQQIRLPRSVSSGEVLAPEQTPIWPSLVIAVLLALLLELGLTALRWRQWASG